MNLLRKTPMKVLFCEFLYPLTHSRSNSFYINCLNEVVDELHVMSPKGFYKNLDLGVINHDIRQLSVNRGKISYRKNTFYYMYMAYKIVCDNKIDKCIVASSDYITLLFFKILLPNLEIYMIHHAELDSLYCNKLKRLVFAIYKNRIRHFVFEEYIKIYLRKELKIKSKIIVMPHSLNKNEHVTVSKTFDLVGLSNSNDEDIICSLIQYEIDSHELKRRNMIVVLKSQKYHYNDGALIVLNGYLSDDEYNRYINGAKYIFIPFPKNFCYRESGTLMDALSNGKKVIASNVKLVNEYSKLYPSICFFFNTITDIMNVLMSSICDEHALKGEFDNFKKIHSKAYLIDIYKSALYNVD